MRSGVTFWLSFDMYLDVISCNFNLTSLRQNNTEEWAEAKPR